MSDPYACLTCGDCHPGPCLPPALPTPEALRTILDVTVHARECEKVLRAYVEGRLIDGQAIADAWKIQGPRPEWHRRAQDKLKRDWPTLYRAITGAFTKEDNDG